MIQIWSCGDPIEPAVSSEQSIDNEITQSFAQGVWYADGALLENALQLKNESNTQLVYFEGPFDSFYGSFLLDTVAVSPSGLIALRVYHAIDQEVQVELTVQRGKYLNLVQPLYTTIHKQDQMLEYVYDIQDHLPQQVLISVNIEGQDLNLIQQVVFSQISSTSS